MSRETDPSSSSEEAALKEQMLCKLEEAVLEGDFDIAAQIATQQHFLPTLEVITEYLKTKHRYREDSDEARLWNDGLRHLISTLDLEEIEETQPVEAEIIKALASSLKVGEIITGQEWRDESGQEPNNENWDQERFYVDADKETIERVREFPVFQDAVALASGGGHETPNLEEAIDYLVSTSGGRMRDDARIVFDWYVYKEAEKHALWQGDNQPDLGKALKIIETHASSFRTSKRMRAALDRRVFRIAEKYASGWKYLDPNLNRAGEVVVSYASSNDRADAMLERLDLFAR